MKIWIDITNTPHVNVLIPIIDKLKKNHKIFITARDFSETVLLLKQNGIEPKVIGGYGGKSRIMKFATAISRILKLFLKIPEYDIAFSLGGNYTSIISKLRKKPSIVFSDNDISFKTPAYKLAKYFIFPSYFDSGNLEDKYGINQNQIYEFDGFKEAIYIANYIPNEEFLDNLPFNEFITIRPENLKASYVPKNSNTIVPDLFKVFNEENILFLPRYEEEKKYADGFNNIFIPDKPLNGLDVCYYTKAMLTGAGTFAREAALLGTPSVSFFPGKVFLTVDREMQKRGWEFKSRNPYEIYKYVMNANSQKSHQSESKKSFKKFMEIFYGILEKEKY